MYDKLFKENKLVAIYSFSIVFITLLAVFVSGTRNTTNSEAGFSNTMVHGCYYRLNCPPNNSGSRPQFRCLPTLVCPTVTLMPKPTLTQSPRNFVTCGDCINSNTSTLCLNPVRKIAYCTNNFVKVPEDTCTVCKTNSPTPSPSRCVAPPPCLFSEPKCLLPEPATGWCEPTPTPSPFPTEEIVVEPTAF